MGRGKAVVVALVALTALGAPWWAWAGEALPGEEGAQENEVMMRFARRSLPEFLADWSQQTGKAYCYSAWLPDAPVVAAEPGRKVSLEAALKPIGWEAVKRGEILAIVRTNDDRLVPLHRTTLQTSKDELARRKAAYELGRLSVPQAIPPLVAGLEDPSPSVRFHCLEALWAIESDFDMRQLPGRASMMRLGLGEPAPLLCLAADSTDRARRAWRYAVDLLGRAGVEGVRPIALASLADGDPRVRLVAASALRQVATAADDAVLSDFVRRTDDWHARREAVLALAGPGLGKALNLAAAVTGDDEELACLACEGLGYAASADAVPPLKKALQTGRDGRVVLAAEALGRLDRPEAEAVLVEALKSTDAWRVAAAARGLGVLGRERAAATARALAEAGARQEAAVRAAVAEALPACGVAPVAGNRWHTTLESLVALSRDENAQVRLAAVRGLRRLGGKAALARLKELAPDPDALVAHDATRGIGALGGVEEARWLAGIVTNQALGRNEREAATMALTDLVGDEARETAVEALVQALKDPLKCPHAAGRAAGAIADPRFVPGLLAAMKRQDPGRNLRVDGVDALGSIGTAEAIDALVHNFWEYDNMVRYQVGRALRDNAHRPQALATLLAMLKRSGMPRQAGAFSLCNVRDPAAVDELVRVLTVEKGAEIPAATSLGLIADPAATEALLAVARNPEHAGRFAAGRALRMRDLAWQPAVAQALVELYGWRPDGTPPPLEQQKPNTWVLRAYARDYDDMSVSTLCYESGVTYDSRRGRIVQWGAHGRRYDAPQTGETWVYDPATNTWKEAGLAECPPGTCCTREVAYDQVNDRVIVTKGGGGGHGWLAVQEQALRRSVPWVYDPGADRWVAMRPMGAPAFAAFPTHAFDRRHGVLVGYTTQTKPPSMWTYDLHANQWLRQPVKGAVPAAAGYGHVMTYDSRRGLVLFGGKGMLAGYDLQSGTWTDLKAEGQPDGMVPMVYDAVNDVVLGFSAGRGGTAVHAFDPQSRSWTRLTTAGMQPDYSEWDAEFDPERNLVFVCGGEVTSSPGSPNCRETWTYRFGPGRGPMPLKAPGRTTVTVADGRARLTWESAGDPRVTGYVVYRAAGERTWDVALEKLTPKPIRETEFADRTNLKTGQAYVYLVRSVDAGGQESAEAGIARTQPPVPVGVVATYREDGLARVTWEKSPAQDVVAYNVYRAPVTCGDLYGGRPIEDVGTFTKMSAAAVTGTSFVDEEKPAAGEKGWAFGPRAYCVRAVNALGVESGPSPWAVPLPEAVRSIQARRREDGSVVVRWEPDPNPDVVGYLVYRMDNWRGDLLTRVNAVPAAQTVLVDPDGQPTGERQRYWVVAVDRFGQEGPSGTGAWSFNRS